MRGHLLSVLCNQRAPWLCRRWRTGGFPSQTGGAQSRLLTDKASSSPELQETREARESKVRGAAQSAVSDPWVWFRNGRRAEIGWKMGIPPFWYFVHQSRTARTPRSFPSPPSLTAAEPLCAPLHLSSTFSSSRDRNPGERSCQRIHVVPDQHFLNFETSHLRRFFSPRH